MYTGSNNVSILKEKKIIKNKYKREKSGGKVWK